MGGLQGTAPSTQVVTLTIGAADCIAAPSGASLIVTSDVLPASARYLASILGDPFTAFDDGGAATITAQAALSGAAALDSGAVQVDVGAPATLPAALTTEPLPAQNTDVGGETLSLTLTVSTPVPPDVTGTGDTTTGAWYGGGGTLDGLKFTITSGIFAPVEVTFAAPANAAALLSQINSAAGLGTVFTDFGLATIAGDRVVITGQNNGVSAFTLAAGVPDALATLGITADTYTATSTPGDVNNIVAGSISVTLIITR